MPTYQVTDPSTRQTLKLTGDSPPTEAELEEIFSNQAQQTTVETTLQESPESTQQVKAPTVNPVNEMAAKILGFPVDALTSALNAAGLTVGSSVGGSESIQSGLDALQAPAEAAAVIASGAAAEPIAGVAGVVQSLNPLAEEGAGAEAVEATRGIIGVDTQNKDAQKILSTVGETIAPVGEAFKTAEDFLGDNTLEATGSPALAAAAKTIPTALTEALGFAIGKGALKGVDAAKEANITKEIAKAAPSIDQLKSTSRQVFKEIDGLGLTVKAESFDGLVKRVSEIAKKGGLDKDITPDSAKALKRFSEKAGENISLSDLDILREVAQGAAGSLKPKDARLGSLIIDAVDDFLDNANTTNFDGAPQAIAEVGNRYKVARKLWGRARRSELLEKAFEDARNQASGFENGIRTQFRALLKNKRTRKFFNEEELTAMNQVVRGSKKENIAKLIGRLGFSEGSAVNIVTGTIGATAGLAAFGGPGAIAVPVIGAVSKKLAQRLTVNNAEFADQVIRAGKDARKITRAYLKNTPTKQRSSSELAELLMKPDIDLKKLPQNVISFKAAKIVKERRQAGGAAAAAGSAASSASAEEN